MKKRILSTLCAALLLSSCGVAKKAAYQSSIDSNDEFEIGYLTRSGTIIIEKDPIIRSYVRDGVVADRLVLPNTVKVSLATTSRTRPGRHSGTGYLHQIRAFDRDVEIPLPQRSRRGQCYVLSNRDWKGGPTNPPVKLRANEMDSIDQYGFANVYPLIAEAVDEKRVRFENTESELRRTTQNLESTMASLAGDPNLIGDTCTEPPMQAIPPRPEMPFSDNEINFQVAGFCMELMTVRYNKLDVYQMLSSGQMTDLVNVHQT